MWPNPQETADLLTFIEEILNQKLHILRSEKRNQYLRNFLIYQIEWLDF